MNAFTCADAEPLLPLVADGAVDPASDPDLFAHLAACPACQRAVAEHDLITLALERGAAARRAAPAPARILAFPRLAAAAVLVLAAGAAGWLLLAPRPPAAPPLARAPAVTLPAVAVQPAAAPAASTGPSEVLRIRREDGSSVYLVRRGDGWVAMDPALLDGPDQAATPTPGGIQVRN